MSSVPKIVSSVTFTRQLVMSEALVIMHYRIVLLA